MTDSLGPSEYQKLLEQEAKKRQDIMIEIIKSRGVTYSKDDLADGIAKTLQIRKAFDDRLDEQIRPYMEQMKKKQAGRTRMMRCCCCFCF